jgi:hypothetical protein
VSIAGLKGDALCNALMKSETKSKRRVTLSICGLGLLDESEVGTIKDARPFEGELPRELSGHDSASSRATETVVANERPVTDDQKTLITRLCNSLIEMGVYIDKKEAWSAVVSTHPRKAARLDSWSEDEAAAIISMLASMERKATEEKQQQSASDDAIF